MKLIMNTFILIFMPIVCFAASPENFFGTYETSKRDCGSSFLVIDKEKLSIGECKKSPYKIIGSSENHIVIDVMPSKACARRIIKIESKEEQYKAESKGPRSDIPTFLSLIVTTFENYDDAKTNRPIETFRYMRVDPSKANDQIVLFLNGKTHQQRKLALHEMNLQCYEERNKYNEIGFRDSSPDVRAIAASFLGGKPEHFVPMLIKVMVNDPNAEVRASAGYSLSHFYTDNGSDGYLYIKTLEDNLDKLLKGLKNKETARSVVNILGNRYTGDSVTPCYMSINNREKILRALSIQLKTIHKHWAEERRGYTSDNDDRWNNEWNEADHEIPIAMENISKCQPTKR